MKKAVIIPGWYQKVSSNWYPWLKNNLEQKGYIVYLPDLPTMHTDLPDMELQLKTLEDLVSLDKETIIFGHSIGCLLAMRLAEKHRLDKIFLIAGWDFDDLTPEHKLFWRSKINHKKIMNNVKKIYCITSDNDPYMTAFTVEQMSKRLHAEYLLIKNTGHFTDAFKITQIPELENYF